MKERPILFSAPMVRAILEGRKTQTRRIVKDKHVKQLNDIVTIFTSGDWDNRPLPYGGAGDFLWVRETFVYRHKHDRFYYKADYPRFEPYAHDGWKPSIHMPRKASRILLEITGVRIERLQDISTEEIKKEGLGPFIAPPESDFDLIYKTAWINLWDSINFGRGYGWEKNPWVWVISFRSAVHCAAGKQCAGVPAI